MRLLMLLVLVLLVRPIAAADPAARLAANQQFLQLSRQPTGLLIPLYVYPADIHTNATYNKLIALKRAHPRVPVIAIVNPASGPGEGDAVDANYTKAIDRLIGAGIVVVGYVSTSYAKVPRETVEQDMAGWQAMYPRVHGIFLDEMTLDADAGEGAAHVAHYRGLTQHAHELGYWPVIANPGTGIPAAYFDAPAADIFVIHEGNDFLDEATLAGDYFGGYADYPPWTRAVLMHSQAEWSQPGFERSREHVRWLYVTERPYTQPTDNPWDQLTGHIEQLFEELDR